ncbi:MAG: family 10 glycosylhydrolase [Leptolyngbya sp. SIOISBB]|nr:family 10 glycosylhydrolase [Leptolyngbya sp. SIOISBB]
MKRLSKWLKRLKQGAIFFIIAIFLILIFQKVTEAPPHQPQTSQVIRGVWMTHVGSAFYAWTGQLDDVFHQLSRLNFNRVYISVYNDGVTYPSQISHRNQETNLPLNDFLNSAIYQGHRQGLKIYAWFEYGLILHDNDPLAQAHPDWLLNHGQVVNGFVWLNPSHPEVEQYFIDLFTEFADRYHELDGIQLDDHWAVPQEFGDYVVPLTRLTETITTTIKKINPHWILSLSPNPPEFAYRNYSQDWPVWVDRGYFDEIIVQIYRPTVQAVATTLTQSGLAKASQQVSVAAGIFTGFLGDGLAITQLSEATQQVELVLDQGYGFSLFTYEYTFSFLRPARTRTKEAYFQAPKLLPPP